MVFTAFFLVVSAGAHAASVAPASAAPASATVASTSPALATAMTPDPETSGLEGALALPEYAGGSGDALQLCCMATWCTTAFIDDCDLISPMGKAFAASTAVTGGLVGFGMGYLAAVVLLQGPGDYIVVAPFGDIINDSAEGYATLGLLGGTAGVIVGGAVGLTAALLVEPWFRFFFAVPTPRSPLQPPYLPPTAPPPTAPPSPQGPGTAPPRP